MYMTVRLSKQKLPYSEQHEMFVIEQSLSTGHGNHTFSVHFNASLHNKTIFMAFTLLNSEIGQSLGDIKEALLHRGGVRNFKLWVQCLLNCEYSSFL